MGHRRIPRCLVAAALLLGICAAPAAATVSIDEFTVTADPPKAGTNPDVRILSKLSTPDGDDVKNLTLSLAPGLLANPAAVTPCKESDFTAGDAGCAAAQVGDGTAKINVTGAGEQTAQLKLFLVEPAGGLPRFGLSASALGARLTSLAAVTLRADAGLDVAITDLARTVSLGPATAPLEIRELDLVLKGTVDGKPFTRLPTSCAESTTRTTIQSHDQPTTNVTRDAKLTATDCGALPFAPTLAASAAITPGTDGVEFTSTIGQAAGESAQKQAVLSLPAELNPRLSALGAACPTSVTDINACPATATVGSASATTPLLPVPLTGKLVLKAGGTALPLLVIAFPAPVPLQLTGQTSLAGSGLVTTFAGIPDVPLSSLSVKINGGANSVLQALPGLCTGAKPVGGSFTGHSGKTAATSTTLVVTGACPAGQTPPGQTPSAGKPSGKLTLTGLAKRTAKLVARLTVPSSGSPAKTVKLTLPKGLTIDTKKAKTGVKVRAGGKTVKAKVTRTGVSVTLTGSGARSVEITVSGGALKASAALVKKVKAKKGGTLKAKLTVRDAAGKSHSVSISAKAR